MYLTCETDQSDEGLFFFIVKRHPRECQDSDAKHQPRGEAGSLRFQVYNLVRLSCLRFISVMSHQSASF